MPDLRPSALCLQCSSVDRLSQGLRVLGLICKQKSADLGLELLSQWSELREGESESLLVEAIYRWVTSDTSCSKLEGIVAAIRNDRIAALVRYLLVEVVEVAKQRPDTQCLPGLLSCLGIAQARGSDTDRRSRAVKYWTEALSLASDGDDDNAEYHHCLCIASRCFAQHEFEQAKAKLANVSFANSMRDEKIDIANRLEDQIKTFYPDSEDFGPSGRETPLPISSRLCVLFRGTTTSSVNERV